MLGLCRAGSGALVEGVAELFMGSKDLTMGVVVGLGSRNGGARVEFPTSVLGFDFAASFVATEGGRDVEDSTPIGITGLSAGVLATMSRCFVSLE